MNAARRERQKDNRAAAGRHTGRDHQDGTRCASCRPGKTGKQAKPEQPEAWRPSPSVLTALLRGYRQAGRMAQRRSLRGRV